MVEPCPRLSPNNPLCPQNDPIDYNIKSPIGSQWRKDQPLCKTKTKSSRIVDTWKAGSAVTVRFREDGSTHGGGHCQFAVSYDDGDTFVVIKDVLQHCFTKGRYRESSTEILAYEIQLPFTIPSCANCIFAWTWINADGTREYYMNCADIAIKGVNGGTLVGPKLLVANYGSDTPVIPEFNGNYSMGIDLFDARPTITATGDYSNPDYISSSFPTPAPDSIKYSQSYMQIGIPTVTYSEINFYSAYARTDTRITRRPETAFLNDDTSNTRVYYVESQFSGAVSHQAAYGNTYNLYKNMTQDYGSLNTRYLPSNTATNEFYKNPVVCPNLCTPVFINNTAGEYYRDVSALTATEPSNGTKNVNGMTKTIRVNYIKHTIGRNSVYFSGVVIASYIHPESTKPKGMIAPAPTYPVPYANVNNYDYTGQNNKNPYEPKKPLKDVKTPPRNIEKNLGYSYPPEYFQNDEKIYLDSTKAGGNRYAEMKTVCFRDMELGNGIAAGPVYGSAVISEPPPFTPSYTPERDTYSGYTR
ncbi:hypothetical protein AX774_g3789 [Zancudomyces culisetae]|uniref:Uncharacterized protein n=1 Tax=Zancudomyces culisetae TaxID=1213189 RepID=A0A1R1PP23_ZANCU|nr:hypothetical protein AX774_g3789 [Zancudomyces culisetae]|eukprot:OMH82717.1 hypothetical protein AX774_g3789 [Zancudomyces culisetae]